MFDLSSKYNELQQDLCLGSAALQAEQEAFVAANHQSFHSKQPFSRTGITLWSRADVSLSQTPGIINAGLRTSG